VLTVVSFEADPFHLSTGSPSIGTNSLRGKGAVAPKNEPARAGGITRHGQHIIDEVRRSSA